MRSLLRQVLAWLAWAFVAALVVQVWLAGAAIPQLGGTGSFETHRNLGYGIGLFSLVLLIVAIVAGVGRRRIGHAAAIFGLYIVQSSLPYLDEAGMPAIAALHPVNALVMFGVAVWFARRVWIERGPAAAVA
jgi:hypothetical protein